jgi:multiple sugar transport system permease protein
MERLFESPAVGEMSPVSKIVAYGILFFWSLFVLFPLYWVVITAFKNGQIVNEGPYYIPFVDFQPTLDGWRAQFATDSFCDAYAVGRQLVLYFYNALAFVVSPVVSIQPMEPQICKVWLAFTNSVVINIFATALCMIIGSMAAYALARIQYKPKFGNVLMFVLLSLAAIIASYVIHWAIASTVALALFFLLARAFGKHYKNTLGNGDILFWIISQRILPPIVVIIPIYMMFQAVGLLDTHLALIIAYAVANLPIVVWLMHDFFAGLPIELEESAQLDGATRFGIFWDIVLPLTRPGFAGTRQIANHAVHGGGKERWRAWHSMVGNVRNHRRDDHSGHHHGHLSSTLHCQGRFAWRGKRIGGFDDGKCQYWCTCKLRQGGKIVRCREGAGGF